MSLRETRTLARWRRRKRSVRLVPGWTSGLILWVLVSPACGSSGESTLERIRRDGFIRVGYATEEPYAYVAAGRVTGESPEVARAILRRLRIDSVVWLRREFDTLIPDLIEGRFDLIALGMFITPERQGEIAFTLPTFCVGPALLVRRGNPRSLHSYEDVRADTSARLAVLRGAVEEQIARAVGIPERRLIAVPDQQTGLAAVRLGRADALALTVPSVNWMVRNDASGGVERAEPFRNPRIEAPAVRGCGALGVRKNDRALLDAVNRELRSFVGSEAHRALMARFGFADTELPPWASAPEKDRMDAR